MRRRRKTRREGTKEREQGHKLRRWEKGEEGITGE